MILSRPDFESLGLYTTHYASLQWQKVFVLNGDNKTNYTKENHGN